MKRYSRILSLFVIYSMLVFVLIRPELVNAQTRERPDPRGLDRYTLTGETAPLSIFSIPPYNPRDKRFFDGFSERKTADELGLTGLEFWNEFGTVAKKGRIHGKAIIRFPNGFQWNEAYLEGCTKSGKPYFNRILFPKKPEVIPELPKVELCINIAIAVKDVPTDWSIVRESAGPICNYPTPEPVQLPAIDNTCKPGGMTRIFEEHNKKGFNPTEVVNKKLTGSPYDLARITSLMAVTEATAKITDLVIYFNGCDYAVYGFSMIKKGLGWWKWLIPVAIVAAFFIGRWTAGNGKNKNQVIPVKVENIPPDRGGSLLTSGDGFRLE